MLINVRTLTGKEIEIDLSVTPSAKPRHDTTGDEEMKDAGEEAKGDGEDMEDTEADTFKDPKNIKVSEIKIKIEEKEGIPPDQQRLIFKGKQLHNDTTIGQAEIEPGSMLHLVVIPRNSGPPRNEAEMLHSLRTWVWQGNTLSKEQEEYVREGERREREEKEGGGARAAGEGRGGGGSGK